MNSFCSLEDGLEELEELEENDVIGCYHELFFLPVSFQSPSSHWKTLEDAGRRWKEIGRTRCRLSFEQHGRRGLSALPENLKEG